jgi:hypothetical protein
MGVMGMILVSYLMKLPLLSPCNNLVCHVSKFADVI